MLKKIAIFSLILAAFSLYAEGEYEGKLQETVVTATGFSDNIENQIKILLLLHLKIFRKRVITMWKIY